MKIIRGLLAIGALVTVLGGAALVSLFALLGATGFALFRLGSNAESNDTLTDSEPIPYEPMTLEEVRAL